LLFVLLGVAYVSACAVCGETSLSEVTSPDGDYVATVFRRNCGATSALLYHVNIRKRSSSNSADHRGVIEQGQVFLTDAGKVTVFWKAKKNLVVDCEGGPLERKPIMTTAGKTLTSCFNFIDVDCGELIRAFSPVNS